MVRQSHARMYLGEFLQETYMMREKTDAGESQHAKKEGDESRPAVHEEGEEASRLPSEDSWLLVEDLEPEHQPDLKRRRVR